MWILTWLKSVQKHKIFLCWNWEDREEGERDGECWRGVKKEEVSELVWSIPDTH